MYDQTKQVKRNCKLIKVIKVGFTRFMYIGEDRIMNITSKPIFGFVIQRKSIIGIIRLV